MNTYGLTASITAIANALSCNLTTDELTLLASILVQLGDTLVTISTLRTACKTNKY